MSVSFKNDILPLKNQLYRLALRITQSAPEAEDIVQDTLMKIWGMRDKWARIDNIEAFCLTMCRNLSLDHVKRMEHQNLSLDTQVLNRADNGATPSEVAVVRDHATLVRHIIDALPEKQRTCIQLRDIEGKPYKEIAKIMGITEEQVKINIFRGRQTIRERFSKLDAFGV